MHRPIQDCTYPWLWLVIDSHGVARPCCHASAHVGNINEQSIDEIWNGDLLIRLRGAIRDGHIDPICRHAACAFVQDTEAAFGADAYKFPCELDKRYVVSDVGSGRNFCSSGWSDPEYWGVWSDGERATLDLVMAEHETADLLLNVLCRAIGNKDHPPPEIRVKVNGHELDRWKFRYPEDIEEAAVWKTTIIPAHIGAPRHLDVCFIVERPLSPALWMGEDVRQLGIGISALVVSRAERSTHAGVGTLSRLRRSLRSRRSSPGADLA
jgi:hypothetical protein